ncbi:HAMP domain-containing sensor histidine kinase [Nocardiopsis sp. RV163]|uniref:sensor histidine kinase n=1 Tax=Nocardiopsis sp. RV163 TaxID=1661388 RepID=UPI00064C2736|nr:HAMP domain-containing sensor histidine kinase [Nocardiopsis sp. RV163]
MNAHVPGPSGSRGSARLRLALSYAGFLVAAGLAVMAGVYVVLRYVPDYPLTAANPRDSGGPVVPTRGQILDAVIVVSGVVLVVLAVIGLVGGWFLAGWVLRPLHRINEAVRIAASGRLEHRIRLYERDDEFRQLADAFDHMLDRLENAFETQERFAANASHELRTPLAVTATLLDVARRDPEGQDVPRLVERLSVTNARAVELTEALLRLADANAVTAVSAPVDLADIVRGVVAENSAEAERRGVRLYLASAPAPTLGDPALLTQLTQNLVQNALRHNSGRGGTASVGTGRSPGAGAVLRVDNTGPHHTPETVARLHEPFLRGRGRFGPDSGHGLGLALVARVVEVHGGALDLRPRAGGGLTVTVTLPRLSGHPTPSP